MCIILLKEHHQIDIPEEDNIEASLNHEERNALRYTAGYITRGLIKKLKRLCSPRKKQLIAYLIEMNTDEELRGVAKDESEDWVDLVDRGGLTHIGSMTFGVFGFMELKVWQFLARNPSQLGEIKEELCKRIVSDKMSFSTGQSFQLDWKLKIHVGGYCWSTLSNTTLLSVGFHLLVGGFRNTSRLTRGPLRNPKVSENNWFHHQSDACSQCVPFFVKCLVNLMHAHCKLIE